MAKTNSRTFWRLLRPHVLPRLPVLGLVAALGSLAAFCQLGPIMLLEPLWPAMFPGESLAGTGGKGDWIGAHIREWSRVFAPAGASETDQRLAVLYTAAIAITALGVLGGVAQYGFVVLSRWVAIRMVVDLRQRVARHLMGLSVRYHGQRRFGDLMSRIGAAVQNTLHAIDVGLKDLVQEPAQAAAGLAIAIYAAPTLTFKLVLALVVLALPVAIMSRKVRKGSRKSLTSLGASLQALTQMLQGIRTVKAFRAEERELERYRQLNERYLHHSMKMVRAIATSRGSTMLLSSLGMGALLVVLGLEAIQPSGEIESGADVGMFVIGLAQAYNHIRRATSGFTRVQESMGASELLQGLLDERADLVLAENPLPIAGLGSGLRLEGVSYRYEGSTEEALSGVDLVVRPGEKLAVVGPSGAGKSTLIDLVARFIDPTAGRITVDGKDLRQLDLDQWTALYAMVAQMPFLFHASVAENIRYGKPDATQAEIEAAARAASIHDFIASLPEGYDTDVADAGSRLSGGQRQRIAIARALLKGAPLLLLDEATSALDSEAERAVQDALDTLMEGRTVIVIAHRLSTIRNAHRIAVFDGGRLVELGSHDELLRRGGTYARLHALQAAPAPV